MRKQFLKTGPHRNEQLKSEVAKKWTNLKLPIYCQPFSFTLGNFDANEKRISVDSLGWWGIVKGRQKKQNCEFVAAATTITRPLSALFSLFIANYCVDMRWPVCGAAKSQVGYKLRLIGADKLHVLQPSDLRPELPSRTGHFD